MKPIPKELQPYTDALRPYDGYDRNRPWWTLKSIGPGRDVELVWTRTDGRTAKTTGYSTGVGTPPVDLPATDKANPLPPPKILVGQVWAVPRGVGRLHVVTVAATLLSESGDNKVWWSNCQISEDWALVRQHGFLLSCPYGYAPWSGPEAP